MSWFLTQLAAWVVVLVPTLLGTRCVMRRIRRMPCGMPLMVIVLVLAATVTLLVAPVELPMGAAVLPFSAIVGMAYAANFEKGAPLMGDVWQAYAPSGHALALSFLFTSALLWLILRHKPRQSTRRN